MVFSYYYRIWGSNSSLQAYSANMFTLWAILLVLHYLLHNCQIALKNAPSLRQCWLRTLDIVTLSISNPRGQCSLFFFPVIVITLCNSGRLGQPSKSWLNRTRKHFFWIIRFWKTFFFFSFWNWSILGHFKFSLPRTLWLDDTHCGSALCQCHHFLVNRQETPIFYHCPSDPLFLIT